MSKRRFIRLSSVKKLKRTYDKNDRFVLKTSASFLLRLKNFELDSESIEFICWVLGDEMLQVGEYLLKELKGVKKAAFEAELYEAEDDGNEYSETILEMLKKIKKIQLKRFETFLNKRLKLRIDHLSYTGLSNIERNIDAIKDMFSLNQNEVELCKFLFIVRTYDEAGNFFIEYLGANKFRHLNYLCSILNVTRKGLDKILSSKLKDIGLIDDDISDISLAEPFLYLFQNPYTKSLSKQFFVPIPENKVPLEQHFISEESTQFILGLLKEKPDTATHILLYGYPGTGKSSYAYGIAEHLNIPTYEIVRKCDNTALERRTSISACLNMTNEGDGSLILVDEADNLLNTQNSWFRRGETQDKGWLNKILEKPGTRMIWITNRIDDIEESVLRRFAFSLQFKPFSKQKRITMWKNILNNNNAMKFCSEIVIERFVKRYDLSAGVIDLAVKKALEVNNGSRKRFQKALEMSLEAKESLLNDGFKQVNKNSFEESYSLEGLNADCNLNELIDQLKEFNKFLKHSNDKNPINMNILFYGNPGTGKSELAKYIANQLDKEVIFKHVSDLQSKYVGEGEKNIKYAFLEAESNESILVIDEADSFLFNRDRAQRSWEISFTNEFLTQMESFRGILICTSNRFNDLDYSAH